jgi:hypothetical protein
VVVVTAAIYSGRGQITVRPEGPDCAGPAAGGLPDDEIFDKASNFLQQAVDETVQDPEFRALVTTMVLDRVGGTAEADVHNDPEQRVARDDRA